VLGAGVSRGAGLPDARQLAEWLLDNVPMLDVPKGPPTLFEVVDAVDTTRMPAEELPRRVASHIERFPLRPTPFLEELVRLPSRFIVTFNYDDLIGVAAQQQGLKVCRLSGLNLDELVDDRPTQPDASAAIAEADAAPQRSRA
jgi:hypothetical protein